MNEMNGTERRLNLSQDSQLAERDVFDSESNVSPFLKASYIAFKVPILNMDNLCSSDKIMAKAFKKSSKSSQNSKPGDRKSTRLNSSHSSVSRMPSSA